MILNVYANKRTSKYVKQKLTELKGEIGKFIIVIGYFNTSLSKTDKTREKNQEGSRRAQQHH